MKKLLYLGTSMVLCLLFSLLAGCEKKPLEESGGNSGGGGISNQKGAIEGVVTAKDTDKPVLLASVQLLPTDKLTLTDTSGSFQFKDIEPGTYKLEIKHNGYATYTSGEIRVEAGKTVRHNIALEAIQSNLQILDTNAAVISELNVGNSSHGVFLLKNAGEEIVEWEIPKLAVDWISGFSKQAGKLAPGALDTVELTIDRFKLSEGANEAVMYIGSSVGDKKLLIKAGVERSFCFTDAEGNEISELDLSNVEQYRFNIKNTGNDVLTWTVGEIEVNWLTFVGKADGKLDAGEVEARTLKVDRTYLEEGTYETTLVFRTNAGDKMLPIKVKVEMAFRLEDDGGLEITELDWGTAPSNRFRIRNTGNGVLEWQVSCVESDWLTLGDKRRGRLQPGTTETVSMMIDRTRLSEGDHQEVINISTNAGDKQLQVNVRIEMSFQLVNAQNEEISLLDLGRSKGGLFKIRNTGSGILEWEIPQVNVDWLSLKGLTKGQIWPDGEETIELTIDRSKLIRGDNETELSIQTNVLGEDRQLGVKAYRLQLSDGVPEMVYVEGGSMEMRLEQYGVVEAEETVTLESFYIGVYEVTQKQYEAVMGYWPYTTPNDAVGDDYPAFKMSLEEAQSFCEKLSEMTGETYRLPTVEEWIYAARGGKFQDDMEYAGSDNIEDVAWYKNNSNDALHPVGKKKPNSLGIYDMSGNAKEWCQERQTRFPTLGGSYGWSAEGCRIGFYWTEPTPYHPYIGSDFGFRVVREL